MTHVISDDEITLIVRECAKGSAINRDGSTSHRIARAIEAAVLAKLREQEPDYWANPDSINHVQMLVNSYQVKGYVPLYLHPAPIPEGWQLVPVDPEGQWSNDDLINIMVDAYQDCNGGYYDSMLAAYKALLAAARSE